MAELCIDDRGTVSPDTEADTQSNCVELLNCPTGTGGGWWQILTDAPERRLGRALKYFRKRRRKALKGCLKRRRTVISASTLSEA